MDPNAENNCRHLHFFLEGKIFFNKSLEPIIQNIKLHVMIPSLFQIRPIKIFQEPSGFITLLHIQIISSWSAYVHFNAIWIFKIKKIIITSKWPENWRASSGAVCSSNISPKVYKKIISFVLKINLRMCNCFKVNQRYA